MSNQKAIIIGAGPAGLTAALELLRKTKIKPIVLEKTNYVGGISKTVNYKGNRIDIGGHRFFSKSDDIMKWWTEILPIEGEKSIKFDEIVNISYQNKHRSITVNSNGPNPDFEEKVMLLRERLSRIYYQKKFFSYPIQLSIETLKNLGTIKVFKVIFSYLKIKFFPLKEINSLEDFIINRFGKELYITFFKSYTEKVWGVPCHKLSADWGAQRIKGLSVTKIIKHAILKVDKNSINQKKTEQSLIERFLYPKYGPGQMWEEVAKEIVNMGGEIIFQANVDGLTLQNKNITEVYYSKTGNKKVINADYVFSSMPIKKLISLFGNHTPKLIRNLADGLKYRDFLTIGILVSNLKIKNKDGSEIKDNWIYIQEPGVKIGRLQIFNNWSPYMVKDKNTVWLGLEYFCNKGDQLWEMNNKSIISFGLEELSKIGIINKDSFLDGTVIRMPKAYPAYLGTYNEIHKIQEFLDSFENLFPIGRNGMHRYNNQDHSMLTAIASVDDIKYNLGTKSKIWEVNETNDYLEKK
ncbi:NAD(P)/FAD-dependent oxidoreductase [Echinicola marina]|uniref:NAD(P)/FAD-dependent oxidoreductase n=1 Tax=Echinicola marina TaxID=2859768 RepID=UPI001CF67E96|nr:NAD(P)/FAD-dependent oxidoreductase [Echinicola marina]UCS92429.1 NAD(P)/FAD-dependent oxidoreductase [Echinicola marina]